MLDHGNWRETVKFQLSVYACLSSVLSTAEGLDATALKLTVSIPADSWELRQRIHQDGLTAGPYGNLATVKRGPLDPRGRIQSVRKLTRVEVIAAPSSAQYRLAVAKQVIGGTQARLVEQRPRREARQWNGAVLGMPLESAVGRSTGTSLATAGADRPPG